MIDMEFVLIPSGSFMMGSKLSAEETKKRYGGRLKWYQWEHPQHRVTITKPFYLQSTQVTQGQWQKVMGDNPSFFEKCGDDCAVENVTWDDTQTFIDLLNKKEPDNTYRLPTEAEWEYAYRAGTTTEFSFGDDAGRLDENAWYRGNAKRRTHPVGCKKPNPWGLYDMHGNVWEWIEDDWHDNYKGAPDDGSAWVDQPRVGDRVLRGGCFFNPADFCRAAFRFKHYSDFPDRGHGFRLVMIPGQH